MTILTLPGWYHVPFALLTLLTVRPYACHAYPSFGLNIPNGQNIRCPSAINGFDVSTCEQQPSKEGSWCSAVGHANCIGGSLPLNPFGVHLKEHGFAWTKALCEADSDGDGLTNGQELGDPCCTWKRGDAPSAYQVDWGNGGASHPGVHEGYSYTAPNCNEARMLSPNVATGRAMFNDWEERRNITWRIRDFQLPHEETTYINVVFNFDETYNETHEEYHIVYGEAIVDQPDHLHHFVVSGCTKKIDEDLEGKALEYTSSGTTFLEHCDKSVGGFWAPGGRPMWDIGTNQGVLIGPSAKVVAFSVNIHYTDGHLLDNSTTLFPTDGITMHYTSDLRPKTHVSTKLINIIGIGSAQQGNGIGIGNAQRGNGKTLEVPPGKKRWYLTRRCTVGNRCHDVSKKELRGLTGGRLESCAPLCMIGGALGSNSAQLCPETCGTTGGCTGGNKPLRVMDSFFHAHLLGTEMYQSVVKQETGEHIDLGSMRHWNYADEIVVPLDSKNLELVAGDVLLSTCVYNTEHMSEATKFGRRTYDEMCLNNLGVELDTADRHYGTAFSCEGAVWSGDLEEHQNGLNIHAPETLLTTSSDCWSKLGHGLDCTEVNTELQEMVNENQGEDDDGANEDPTKVEGDDGANEDTMEENAASSHACKRRTAIAAMVVSILTMFHFQG